MLEGLDGHFVLLAGTPSSLALGSTHALRHRPAHPSRLDDLFSQANLGQLLPRLHKLPLSPSLASLWGDKLWRKGGKSPCKPNCSIGQTDLGGLLAGLCSSQSQTGPGSLPPTDAVMPLLKKFNAYYFIFFPFQYFQWMNSLIKVIP